MHAAKKIPHVLRVIYGVALLLAVAVIFWSLQGGPKTSAAAAVAPYRPADGASVRWSQGFGFLSDPQKAATLQPSQTDIHIATRNVSKECPPWFWEYAAFHKAHRGKPKTKYLVVPDANFGLGDRLHGALSMLRLAKALDRVLLLHWKSPYPLEEFFEPAGALNWTAQGIAVKEGRKMSFVNRKVWSANGSRLHDGSLHKVSDTFLTIKTNMELNWPCHGCPDMPPTEWSVEAACIWQNMFRPVEPILQQARAQLKQLYPDGLRPYVAVHLRLGGLEGEMGPPGPDRGKAPLENFLASVRCASRLASNSSIDLDATPALVVTDNHNLRQMLQEQHFKRVVTPPGLPLHISKAKHQTLEAYRSTVVDMVLLAWSECLATSRSGFSLHAGLYGGAKPCRVPWTTCL